MADATFGFNPIASLQQGLQLGSQLQAQERERRIQRLRNTLAEKQKEKGFEIASSPELQELAALDSPEAGRIAATFGTLSKSRQKSFFQDAKKGLNFLNAGKIEEAFNLASRRDQQIQKLGGDNSDTQAFLQTLGSGDIPGATQLLQGAVDTGIDLGFLRDPLEREIKLKGKPRKLFEKEFIFNQFRSLKQLAATGNAGAIDDFQIFKKLHKLDGLTPEEEAALEIRTAGKIEAKKQRARTNEGIIKTAATDRKLRRRTKLNLFQAQNAIKKSAAGFSAPAKQFFSKIFGAIDVTDEALLSQALTTFALDNLQSFKGPTTNFEFEVAEGIAGRIGDPRSSNQAKLNALDVGLFLSDQEDVQFKRFIREGAQPVEFEFNGLNTFQGRTLSEISNFALINNVTIEEAIRRLKRQGGLMQQAQPGTVQPGGVLKFDAQGNLIP